MSRIDNLVHELAPNGVRFATLGDVGEFVRGNGLQKKDLIDDGVPAIHYGQIHTTYGTWATDTVSFVAPELAKTLRRAAPGDLVLATTSEDDEAVAKAVAWLGNEETAVSGDAYIYRHTLEPKYVSYFFQSDEFQDQKKRSITGTKVRRISGDALAKVKIPVPPLDVQREIARILDEFSALETKLAKELDAELEARRRQYAFYRSRVFADLQDERVPLARLGQWTCGITPSKAISRYWTSGTIPWLASMDVSASGGREIRGRVTQEAIDETSLRIVLAPTVAVVMRSNILRRVLPIGRINVDVTVNQDIRLLAPREGVDADYVYQALQAAGEDIRSACVRTDGSMAAVDSGSFFAWTIPLPPLAEQRRIAAALDKFDALVSDLSVGLPAERNARRKQYKYYRDKLFAFKEFAA